MAKSWRMVSGQREGACTEGRPPPSMGKVTLWQEKPSRPEKRQRLLALMPFRKNGVNHSYSISSAERVSPMTTLGAALRKHCECIGSQTCTLPLGLRLFVRCLRGWASPDNLIDPIGDDCLVRTAHPSQSLKEIRRHEFSGDFRIAHARSMKPTRGDKRASSRPHKGGLFPTVSIICGCSF